MELEILIMTILGASIGVISYFLKGVIDEVKNNKNDINDLKSNDLGNLKSDLRILENDTRNKQDFILEKINDINVIIKDLVIEIKIISKYLTKNMDE